MNIKRSRQFIKMFEKLPKTIQLKVFERMDLFARNPLNPLLRLHELKGDLAGTFSINITGDYRAWFTRHVSDNETIVTFITVGTHSQLY